jgi:hypothetical protein
VPEFEILCLANSRKMGGRCVAGLTANGDWIRSVSNDADGTLYRQHYLMGNGAEASILDVVQLRTTHPRPVPHQHENWEISGETWSHRGRLAPDRAVAFLRQYAEAGPDLFGNRSDRVSYAYLVDHPAPASLALVESGDLEWHITSSISGKRQTRCRFTLQDATYDLSVTDPLWEARLRDLPHGLHACDRGGMPAGAIVFLTISLGEPFQGSCFKLVAGIVVVG